MAKITGIPLTSYLRYIKRLNEPRKYRYPARLSGEDIETIYQTENFALYRRQHNVYLAAAVRCHVQEKVYLLSPYTPVIKAVVKVLGLIDTAGYRMTSTLEITDPNGEPQGTLMHHIAADFFSIRLDFLIGKRVRFRRRKDADGVYDYRLCNVWFPEIEYLCDFPPVYIDHFGDDIFIYREDKELTTVTDYSRNMFTILNTYPVHPEARDKREKVYVDKTHGYYLYQMRWAENIYAYLPLERSELIETMSRFECEHRNYVMDHLDENCRNDRLENLMIMTKEQNNRKSKIARKALGIEKKYWYKVTRYDDFRVRFESGIRSPDGKMKTEMCDILEVDNFIEAFAEYVEVMSPQSKEKENKRWTLWIRRCYPEGFAKNP